MARAALVLVALLVWPLLASAAPVFSVSGVAVDVTAEDAEAAKAQALAQAQRIALARLFARLALEGERDRLPAVDRLDVGSLVRAFEVEDEKVAPNRYIATLTIHFAPDPVRRLLRGVGVAFAETMSEPVVVLPLWRAPDGVRLWEEDNPWREAWAALPPADGLVPFVLPLGELADLVIVDGAKAAAGDRAALERLAERYEAGSVLVAEAAFERDGQGALVRVTTQHYLPAGVEVGGATYRGPTDSDPRALLGSAARGTRTALTEAWKAGHVLRFDREGTLLVDIPLRGFDDWMAVRRRLASLALVQGFEVSALNVRFARLNLHYLGDIAQLAAALAREGLMLRREDDLWVLSLAGGDDGARVEASGAQ